MPLSPPTRNCGMNASANSIEAVYRSRPPHSVPRKPKYSTPAGMEVLVGDVKGI
jgi:hypothetical protein